MGAARQSKPRGAALLLCMIFTSAALTMILVLSARIVGHVRHAERHAQVTRAFAAAEAALHLAMEDLKAGGQGLINTDTPLEWGPNGEPLLPSPKAHRAPASATTGAETWYAVTARRDTWPNGIQAVYGVGRVEAVERRLELTIQRDAAGAWKRITWRELKPGDWEEP